MANPGGKLSRSLVPPETTLLDHEARIKILERGDTVVGGGGSGTGILSGFGPPPDVLGNVGDWYIDRNNYNLYGPRDEVGWPDASIQLDLSDVIVQYYNLNRDGRWFHGFSGLTIAAGASYDGESNLSSQFIRPSSLCIGVRANHPCRIRNYATAAHRAADASRPVGTPPDVETDHGLLMEVVLTADVPRIYLSPAVQMYYPLYTAPGGSPTDFEKSVSSGKLVYNVTSMDTVSRSDFLVEWYIISPISAGEIPAGVGFYSSLPAAWTP